MSFELCRAGALEYLRAPALSGAVHCFSTRYGGVSRGALSSLNLGLHRGDDPENVLENYKILGAQVGFSPEALVFTHQTHTCTVRQVDASARGEGLLRPVPGDYDGLITDAPGVALAVFSADCTPILLYDPVNRAIGAVHAGWRGTAGGIVKNAVELLCSAYGCVPANIRAAIGPCIGQCCFETDENVPNAMRRSLGAAAEAAICPRNGKYFVDLKALNRLWLQRCGVTQISISPACTRCDCQRFWSHRVVGDARGAQAAIIMLKEGRDAPC